MSIKYKYKGVLIDTESEHVKLNTSGKYLEDDVEIEAEGGGSTGRPEKPESKAVLNITENGKHTLLPPTGEVFNEVEANVNVQPDLEERTVIPAAQQQIITPSVGKDGISKVTVEPVQTEQKQITANGQYTPSSGKFIDEVNVNVQPLLQSKSVAPTTAPQIITPDVGYDGLSGVNVSAIQTEEKTVTENGDVTPSSGKYLTKVTVAVPPTPTEEKSVTITENGTTEVTPTAGKLLSKVTISTNVPSGGDLPEHGVFFIDYDGTILETWATNEVAGKTALPDNPTEHPRLVGQGWNWTLANIKSYISSYPNANLWIGQIYRTASGLSEFDITLSKVTGKTVTFKMGGNKDWGDGTTDALLEHTYANYGDYTIKCDGTELPAGSSTTGGLFGSSSSNANAYWCTRAFIGGSVTKIRNYALQHCYSLTRITIANSVTNTGLYIFANCRALKSISIPKKELIAQISAFSKCYNLTRVSIPSNTLKIINSLFSSCYSLTDISIPDGVTEINSNAFEDCYNIAPMAIPSSVTQIRSFTFANCYAINRYDFSHHSSIPTLADANAFYKLNGNCKIIVPDALYDAWIVATNWSTYADYIYKVSEVA